MRRPCCLKPAGFLYRLNSCTAWILVLLLGKHLLNCKIVWSLGCSARCFAVEQIRLSKMGASSKLSLLGGISFDPDQINASNVRKMCLLRGWMCQVNPPRTNRRSHATCSKRNVKIAARDGINKRDFFWRAPLEKWFQTTSGRRTKNWTLNPLFNAWTDQTIEPKRKTVRVSRDYFFHLKTYRVTSAHICFEAGRLEFYLSCWGWRKTHFVKICQALKQGVAFIYSIAGLQSRCLGNSM